MVVITIGLWKVILAILFVGIFGFFCGYEHRVLMEQLNEEG